jgi:hypothetical protein
MARIFSSPEVAPVCVMIGGNKLLLGSLAGRASLMFERLGIGRGVLVTGTQRYLAAECNQNSVSHSGFYSTNDIIRALWDGLEPRPTLALAPVGLNQVFEVALAPGTHDLVREWLFGRVPAPPGD